MIHRKRSNQTLAGKAFKSGRFGLGASFRFGRSRGAFCHSGWCQQCKVVLADGRVGLACRLPAEDLKLLKANSPWKVPISLIARFMRPWFHERVILWPSPLQQLFMRFVRNASRALPLGKATVNPAKSIVRACDTFVIGGGEAGIAARQTLEDFGVEAMLVDEGDLGISSAGHVISSMVAIGIYAEEDGHNFVLCAGRSGTARIFFKRLVVATGTYDRLLPIPGNDLPGIIGLNAFRKLIETDSLPEDAVYGLFASKVAAKEAEALAAAGKVKFRWAAGSENLPDGVASQTFKGVHVTEARGAGRLKAVKLSNGRRECCDVLVVGYQQPRYEFQLQAGQRVSWGGVGAGVEPSGATTVPVLVVGAAAGVTDDVAKHTRESVVDWLNGHPDKRGSSFEPLPGCANLGDDLIVCPCEDVRVGDVRKALRDGYHGIEHLKRRTGAATGPCQGKLCHSLLLHCLVEEGSPAELPTMRPLVRPTALASFGGGQKDA